MLRTPELKPFIIYVRPPPFDVLKETRHQVYIIVNVVIITVIIVNIDHCHHECHHNVHFPHHHSYIPSLYHQAYARSTFDETNSRSFTDDEFRDMIQVSYVDVDEKMLM